MTDVNLGQGCKFSWVLFCMQGLLCAVTHGNGASSVTRTKDLFRIILYKAAFLGSSCWWFFFFTRVKCLTPEKNIQSALSTQGQMCSEGTCKDSSADSFLIFISGFNVLC